jgi:hypothetical protein
MAVVNGISFGQTFTQFCALPQVWMPPSAVSAVLYFGQSRSTRVMMAGFDAPLAEHLRERPSDYRMDIVFGKLKLAAPSDDWGYIERAALLEADFDSDRLIAWNATGASLLSKAPQYFRIQPPAKLRLVEAELLAVILRDSKGRPVVSYGDIHKYVLAKPKPNIKPKTKPATHRK